MVDFPLIMRTPRLATARENTVDAHRENTVDPKTEDDMLIFNIVGFIYASIEIGRHTRSLHSQNCTATAFLIRHLFVVCRKPMRWVTLLYLFVFVDFFSFLFPP